MNKKQYLISEKQRAKKLFHSTRRNGWENRNEFASWFVKQLEKQNFKCFYCETSIFDIKLLIEKELLKARAIGFGWRGPNLEIDKKINDEGYSSNNCVLACYYCNNDKSSIFNDSDYKKYYGSNRKKYFEHLLKNNI